ncbi:hypothetical protein ZHAS_00017384 [Anopheles sinensis]|uniref:Uncharacterized protein n=1 Tax=Anopheles sinensis TaxID=74873 RepID=A0A084WGC8_ANOSI|nr:hypothetical protein ZHAS_00017384 [Anopheles sinensis]
MIIIHSVPMRAITESPLRLAVGQVTFIDIWSARMESGEGQGPELAEPSPARHGFNSDAPAS